MNPANKTSSILVALVLGAFVVSPSLPVKASSPDYIASGAPASFSYATGADYTNGAPGAATDLVIDYSSQPSKTTTNISVGSAQSANSLTFGSANGPALGAFSITTPSTQALTLTTGNLTVASQASGTITLGGNGNIFRLTSTSGTLTIDDNSSVELAEGATLEDTKTGTVNSVTFAGTGTGEVLVSAANTYTGSTIYDEANGPVVITGTNVNAGSTTTTLEAGTVFANNTSGSATGTGSVSVAGGILAGSGTITPTGAGSTGVTVASNGNITPGATPVGTAPQGILTVTASSAANGVTFSAGSSSAPQLTFALGTGTAPSDSSGVSYAGASSYLKLSADITGEVSFNGNYLTLNNLDSTSLPYGNYLLVQAPSDLDYTGLTTTGGVDANGMITNGLSIASSSAFAGDSLYLENGDIYVSVPEPSRWTLMFCGGIFLLVFGRFLRPTRPAQS